MRKILYDRVIDEKGVQVFGEIPGECYMWCFKKGNREKNWTVILGKTGERIPLDDYLYKVPGT